MFNKINIYFRNETAESFKITFKNEILRLIDDLRFERS